MKTHPSNRSITLTICLAVFFSCSAATVAQERSASTVSVPATVEAAQVVDLYAKLGGFIKEISVDIGDVVEEGQLLAVLDVPEMEKQQLQKRSMVSQSEAMVDQANAKVEEASAQLSAYNAQIAEANTVCETKQAFLSYQMNEYNRVNNLVGQGAVQRELADSASYEFKAAQAELKTAKAQIATAKANLAGAKAAIRRAEADALAAKSRIDVANADLEYVKQLMEYSQIRAPFAGEITKRMYDQGAFVQSANGNSAAKPILQLVKISKLRVKFAISMSAVSKLDRGDRVVLSRIDGMKGKEFEGTVTRFSASLDKETRMLRAEMELDNAAGELKPGFFGYVKVYLE